MIDPQLLKTDLETIQTNLKKRDLNIDLQYLKKLDEDRSCLLYTSPSPRDIMRSRMPSSA